MAKANRNTFGEFCPWCGKEKTHFHNHHWPVTKKEGGKQTVRICVDCHAAFHGQSYIVSCMSCKCLADYHYRVWKTERRMTAHFFPRMVNKMVWEPNILILNPSWLVRALRSGDVVSVEGYARERHCKRIMYLYQDEATALAAGAR